MERTEYDSPWKTIIEQHFEAFLAFYFANLHAAVDWSVEPVFLEQELQKIIPESETGSRRVDKLVDVRLKSGENVWLLIHVEVQHSADRAFSERMFTYFYRIFDRFGRYPVSLAILADTNSSWRPSHHRVTQFGCDLRLDFPAAKLIDYDEATLLQSTNPFALVTLAQVTGRRAGKQADRRYATKMRLMRLLLERGYDRDAIRNLLNFIDWILRLPESLQQRLEYELKEYSEENKMEYVSWFERKWTKIGLEQGREEGREEGLENAIEIALKTRFGVSPDALMEKVRQLKEAQLRDLFTFALAARSLEDIENHLADLSSQDA